MKTYFPTINLLRGIAAFMVCFFHFSNFTSDWGEFLDKDSWIRQIGFYGSNGVFVFFVISGFVIPMLLHKEKFKLVYFFRFFARRFIRVEIPYFFSIILILAVSYIVARLLYWDFNFETGQFFAHLIYVIPWTDYEWYNVIYWTLGIEIQYYILMAILFLLINHKLKWVAYLGLFIFGASALIIQSHQLVFYYAPIFLLGIVLFMQKTNRLNSIEAYLFLALFTFETLYVHGLTITLFSIITVVVISAIDIDKPLPNQFGNLSYSLYLIHGTIGGQLLFFLGKYAETFGEKMGLLLLTIILAIAASYLFWYLIERPSQRLSKKIRIHKE